MPPTAAPPPFAPRSRRRHPVTTRLTDGELELLTERAEREGCSFSDLVREGLARVLRERGASSPR